MRKLQAFLRGLMILATLCIVVVTVTLYVIASGITRRTYKDLSREELTNHVRTGQRLMTAYRHGDMDQASLERILNSQLQVSDVFYVLMDTAGDVLAYTESAGEYVDDAQLHTLYTALEVQNEVFMGELETQDTCFVLCVKTADGMVLAGKPMLPYDSAVRSFRAALIQYMVPIGLLLIGISIVLSMYMGRPASDVVNAVQRLSEGVEVQLSETMPMEMGKVGRAFNTVARVLRNAKRDLSYERDTFALVLAGLNEGVIAVNGEGALLHENKAAFRLLGGREGHAYQRVTAALYESLHKAVEPLRLTVNDATLLAVFSPLPAENEEKRGAIAMIRDITEQERLEKTRRDYVANISHELRTPLASMRGIAEGLRDGLVEDKDRQRYYDMIVDEIQRLTRLVNDLLELSRLQAHASAFEMEKVDCAETLYELMDRTEGLAREKGLSLQLQAQEDLPFVRTNEDRLQQVLTILLDNAIKYTPAGGSITLGADKAENGVRFFVRDTGVGMDDYTMRHAFERFYQADPSHGAKGSGLGLSIAREILQKMDVEIRVDSKAGGGSVFYFTLPEYRKA